MISATDVPACPACGSREVHPVHKMPPRTRSETLLGEDPPLETFYACRGCGRDQTDAWKDITPKPKMKPLTPESAARKFDLLNPAPDPLKLGIGAELKVDTSIPDLTVEIKT
jgi:DNA-directed RNA polymerase subunit RPC12/RpoP